MPTTTIHFVRHGKVYNPDHLLYERLPGFHLSDRGMRMAQATGAYIAADPRLNTVAAVYSSPLERTCETAGAILDALNPVRAGRGEEPLELITDPRVIEAGNEFRGKRIGHGKGALWRTVTVTGTPVAPPPAEDNGISLSKRLVGFSGGTVDPAALTQGERVIVVVSGRSGQSRSMSLVVDGMIIVLFVLASLPNSVMYCSATRS